METYWSWENSLKNVIAGLIIIANTLLITIIRTSKKCRRQRFSLVIVSLAVIDSIVGFIIPINTHMINWWTFGPLMCHLMTTVEVVLLCASINNFVLVNLDRLLSLKFPLTYNNKSRTSFKIVKIGIAISCVLAFIPAIPMWIPYVFHTKGNITDGSASICSFPYKSDTWVWTASSVAFIIPTISILTIWIMIAVHLKCNVDTTDLKGRKSFKRITAIMGTLTIAFLVCWWPYAVVFMLGVEENIRLASNLVILAYLNSLINPCLYMIINRDVRAGLESFLCCNNQRRKAVEEMSTTSFSLTRRE